MLSFFRSKEENLYNLKSFKKWMTRFDPISDSHMIYEYNQLGTPEQRLYAAYTSFSPYLKKLIKEELASDSLSRRQIVLQTIYHVFTKKGLHGCSHVLKQDYPIDFQILIEQ